MRNTFLSPDGFDTGSVQSVPPGGGKSTLLEQEMRAIERFKAKQKKEIESIVSYEMRMNQIRKENQRREQLAKEKEARQQKEIERKRRL